MHYGPEKSNDYRTHTSQFSLSMQPLGSGGQIYFETCELKNLSCEQLAGVFGRYASTYATQRFHITAVGLRECHLHRVCSFYFRELIIGTEPPAKKKILSAQYKTGRIK